eukprot:jgi/Chrpa1/3033/Chrysochromulina_OHIO_Genome00014177-RA
MTLIRTIDVPLCSSPAEAWISDSSEPFVLRGAIRHWKARAWSLTSLARDFGAAKVCVRLHPRAAGELYEGECVYESMTLACFCAWLRLGAAATASDAAGGAPGDDDASAATSLAERYPPEAFVAYSDYQDMAAVFADAPSALASIDWSFTGVARSGETTLWLGTTGAHTPTHYDTYGNNVVAQICGVKRWRLHPPSSAGLWPSRVPYEESSVFADAPDADAPGGATVELQPGDVLFVPKHWWHRVSTPGTARGYALSVNTWLESPDDDEDRVREALVRAVVGALVSGLIWDAPSWAAGEGASERPRGGWINPTETTWCRSERLSALHLALAQWLCQAEVEAEVEEEVEEAVEVTVGRAAVLAGRPTPEARVDFTDELDARLGALKTSLQWPAVASVVCSDICLAAAAMTLRARLALRRATPETAPDAVSELAWVECVSAPLGRLVTAALLTAHEGESDGESEGKGEGEGGGEGRSGSAIKSGGGDGTSERRGEHMHAGRGDGTAERQTKRRRSHDDHSAELLEGMAVATLRELQQSCPPDSAAIGVRDVVDAMCTGRALELALVGLFNSVHSAPGRNTF